MKKKLKLLFFIILSNNLLAQTGLDSLKNKMINADEKEKIKLIESFFYSNDSLSNSFEFYDFAIQNFINTNNTSKEIYFQIKKSYKLAENYFFTKCYLLLDSCLLVSQQSKLDSLTALCYYTLAESYCLESDYENAIANYYEASSIYENLKDTSNLINTLNCIGLVFSEFIDCEKAIKLFQSAYELAQTNPKYEVDNYNLINNIGYAYDGLGESEKALEYYLLYYEKVKKINSIEDIILATLNIGDSYRILENYNKAIEYTNYCLDIATESNNQYYIVFAKANLGEIYNQLGQYSKSITILEGVYDEILEFNDNSLTIFYLDLIGKVYFNCGKYKESAENYRFYIQYSDSVFSANSRLQTSGFEAKYQNEKKEQKILLLEKNDEISKEQIAHQKSLRNSFIIGFILMIMFAITVVKAYRNKRKDNRVLKIKNAEILLQKEEIMTQNELLNQQKEEILSQNETLHQQKEEIISQRDEIQLQHDFVSRQNEKISVQSKKITDSIQYAKRIQIAILPNHEFLNKNLQNFFIFFKPKDIVSGDFYFCKKLNEFLIIAVADCTGHGVPGAFMSMLGVSFLNEIVTKREVNQANQVLNELRNQVKSSLQQTGNRGENQDGMDIALCVINTENLKSQFAGAYSPLWIIRNEIKIEGNEKTINKNSSLIIYNSDKMPIGIHPNDNISFKNNEFQLNKNDIIYIFTDGYVDQFGGEEFHKFKISRFKEILTEICELPMNEQKQILENKFNEWKGSLEQTDDVLIVGVKI